MLAGVGWLGSIALIGGCLALSSDDPDPGDQGQSQAEWVACARLIAQGNVLDVRDAPEAGRVIVKFAVTEWIKPATGADQVELDVVDPATAKERNPWAPGGPVLVLIPTRSDLPADTFTGESRQLYRRLIRSWLPTAARTSCPRHWSEEQ